MGGGEKEFWVDLGLRLSFRDFSPLSCLEWGEDGEGSLMRVDLRRRDGDGWTRVEDVEDAERGVLWS